MPKTQSHSKPAERVVALRIPKTLDDKVSEAAAAANLKKSDVFRLSIDRGVDRLLDQLLTK